MRVALAVGGSLVLVAALVTALDRPAAAGAG